MKNIIKKIGSILAAPAIAEVEGIEALNKDAGAQPKQTLAEKIEEGLAEVAYAEAVDYEDIRKSLRAERMFKVWPDECQFGDNDLCYSES